MSKTFLLKTDFIFIIPLFLSFYTCDMFHLVAKIDIYKPILFLMTLASFLNWKYMGYYMRIWFVLASIFLLSLVLESMHDYNNNPMIYPHVFSKIFDLFMMFAIYGFYSRFPDKISFGSIAWIIFFFFLAYSATEGRDGFTIAAFVGNQRFFTADSAYVVVIPMIYFFNHYFLSKKFISIMIFLGLVGFLVFAQQRTVWVVSALSLIINIILIKRSNFRIDIGALIPVFILLSVVFMFVSSFILTNDAIMERLGESIKNFQNTDNDKDGGTAAWRRRQAEAYAPIIEQNAILGLRLKGMELPIQFRDKGTEGWIENSGHHFHSFYLDKSFYFGIVGIALFVLPFILRILTLVFFVRKFIDLEQITTASFCLTMLVFGMSYDIPSFVYGLMGYMFFLLERDNTDKYKKTEQIIEQKERAIQLP